jgi:GNAT superfamily N-acetyltransferase
MGPDGVRIAAGREEDVPSIFRLIKGLAEYERLSHEVVATEDDIRAALFGRSRTAEVMLAFSGQAPIGFALFFTNFSTFLGRPGLYLEDLFVLPEWRGRGVGRRLLAHLATLAVERNYGRMEWAVLDWNARAIGFYERLGAQVLQDWRICRLTGDALAQIASSARDERWPSTDR